MLQLFRENICGMDWHDMSQFQTPIGDFVEKENINELIILDIQQLFCGIDINKVRQVLNEKLERFYIKCVEDKYFIELDDVDDEFDYYEIFLKTKDNGEKELCISLVSQYEDKYTYWIKKFMNPKFYVIESLGCPFKGCMGVDKIMSKPYDTREEAIIAKESVIPHDYSPISTNVIPIELPKDNDWLSIATKIFELESKLSIEERNKLFREDNKFHLKVLNEHFGNK